MIKKIEILIVKYLILSLMITKMNTIQLTIEYLNFDGAPQTTTLQYPRSELISASEYFASQLTGSFLESDMQSIHCDLTTMAYPLDESHIRYTFDLATKKVDFKDQPDNINITMNSLIEMPNITHSYEFNDVIFHKIPMNQCFTIIQLNTYFMFHEITRLLKTSFDTFHTEFVRKWTNKKLSKRPKLNFISMIADMMLRMGDVSQNTVTKCITECKKNILCNEFVKNICHTYIVFKMMNKLKIFQKIVKTIRNNTSTKENTSDDTSSEESEDNDTKPAKMENLFVVPLLTLSFSDTDVLGDIPLSDHYLLSKQLNANFELLELYNYYDMLHYETHSFETYNTQPIVRNHTVVEQNIFDILFQKKTNLLFDNFDWSNVIIAGGFIYGLLNSMKSDHPADIDLFVYGDDVDVQNKIKYLTNYFSKDAYYLIRGATITIIMPEFDFDIHIIPTGKKCILDILNAFDFGYAMVGYDGTRVWTNIAGLTGIKYRVAIYCHETVSDNTPYRVFKSMTWKLEIVKKPILDKIKLDTMMQNQEFIGMLSKPMLARKYMKIMEKYELYFLLKTCYRATEIYRNCTDIIYHEECKIETKTSDMMIKTDLNFQHCTVVYMPDNDGYGQLYFKQTPIQCRVSTEIHKIINFVLPSKKNSHAEIIIVVDWNNLLYKYLEKFKLFLHSQACRNVHLWDNTKKGTNYMTLVIDINKYLMKNEMSLDIFRFNIDPRDELTFVLDVHPYRYGKKDHDIKCELVSFTTI